METVGAGEITYECREKANAMGQFEWVFVGPVATLSDRSGKAVGKYYGPPATWESNDTSKLTGAQVAVAPADGRQHPAAAGEGQSGDGIGRDATVSPTSSVSPPRAAWRRQHPAPRRARA